MFGWARSTKREEFDVVVIGSGAAGMTAAIAAHDNGQKVLLMERTDKIGGTTAVSGGGIWIPCNSHHARPQYEDSREIAAAYCKALTMGRVEAALIDKFVDTAAAAIHYIESGTPLVFAALETPDYHPERPGAMLSGRSIEPAPFDTNVLGEWKEKLRPPSALAFPVTLQEVFQTYQAFYKPWNIPQQLVLDRMRQGIVTMGQALAGGLLAGVLQRGIAIRLSARARSLHKENGRISSISYLHESREKTVHCRRGVVLATAGFEWNTALCAKYLPGRIDRPNSPPFNEGDGLIMALEMGADVANMSEVWNYPSIVIPGETYEEQPLARGIKAERSGPHVIWVNGRGRRFVNEAANYNSIGKAFYEFDANGPAYRNSPAWAVFDSQYRDKYVVGTVTPKDPDPNWLVKADSLQELAALIGVDAAGLQETVTRWNGFVAAGRDADFARGESAFDRYQGDHEASHPNLGSIEKGPFYALPIVAGTLGTKGGPRTDDQAQVLDIRGKPIAGLFAAGNVAASLSGPSYFGVGSTLGPALTWGYIAGNAIAGRSI